MTPWHLTALLSALLVSWACAAGSGHAQTDEDTARFETLRQSPDTYGALIYRGNTFPQKDSSAEPLFRYERRVATTATGLSVAHATRDASGKLIIVESSDVSATYALKRFDVVNQQAGYSGSVRVENTGRRLEYQLNDHGKRSTASEDVHDPVVSGPSMFGYILKNWDDLRNGASLPVRVIVLKEKTTYGFDIRMERQAQGQTTFSITPSSFLVKLAIDPLKVVFDTATKTAVRYEGRVPPMQVVDGKLKDLDARVEYTNVASIYR